MKFIVIRKRPKRKGTPLKLHKGYILPVLAVVTAALTLIALVTSSTKEEENVARGKYEPLMREEIEYALSVDPPEDEGRKALVDAAVSLIGEVHYFWGGKSLLNGADPEWGVLKEVKSSGSRTTGTMRPFGLDCSGFVLWSFIQLGYSPDEAEALVGLGTWAQWQRSYDIAWEDLRPGDLAFENRYPDKSDNHVGICIGYDANGQPVFVHSSSKYDGVVATPAGGVFRYARRPFLFYAEGEGLSP